MEGSRMTTTKTKTTNNTKVAKKRRMRADSYHCCYCSRDVHTLLHHSTKEGTAHKQKQRVGYPTPLVYITAKREAICERCAATHMLALGNGSKPVIGYDRGSGKYYVAPSLLENIGQDIVDLDAGEMYIKF